MGDENYRRYSGKMKIEIDKNAGFCFGVEKAIERAEEELKKNKTIYCLGEIVHNGEEIKRLEEKGLKTITYKEYRKLKNATVFLRAHGEPPETYKIARENNIQLVDATCPIVSKLQNRIKSKYNDIKKDDGQIVIYGKEGHAEIKGLVGQTDGQAIVIDHTDNLERIDFNRPVYLYSQTTKSKKAFNEIRTKIEEYFRELKNHDASKLKFHQTICGQVANRESNIFEFANKHDVILFASGKNSSNGKVLFSVCKNANPRSYFISNVNEVEKAMIENCNSIGISGATSTPSWLLKNIKAKVQSYLS